MTESIPPSPEIKIIRTCTMQPNFSLTKIPGETVENHGRISRKKSLQAQVLTILGETTNR